MAKKKMTISEKRIKEKERNQIISKIKGMVYICLSLGMAAVHFLEEYLIVNSGVINKTLVILNSYLNLVFGSMKLIFLLSLLVIGILNLYEISVKAFRMLSYVLGFLTMSAYITIKDIVLIDEPTIVEAGRKLLTYGFELKGAGLVGAISSVPFYKLSGSSYLGIGLITLTVVFLVISFYTTIRLLFEMLIETNKYYNSEEYKNKVQILEVKRKLEEEERKIVEKESEARFKNIIINKSKENLEKKIAEKPKESYFAKTEYYSKEELEEQQKSWNNYIAEKNRIRQETDKQKREKELDDKYLKPEINEVPITIPVEKKEEKIVIEKEKREVIENIEVKEETPIIPESREEITKVIDTVVVEPIKRLEDADLKKSLEEIFTYKKVNEEEKEKLKQEISENIEALERTLHQYGVEAKVVDYVTGPTITRYEITIPAGVRVNKVTQLSDEITMNLKAKSVRFEAPIPGKGTIGIETPNQTKETVYFSNLIHNKELDNGELKVVLGKDIVGRDKMIDIAKMPHLLIAGQTGSGKSVAINTIISTLISKKTEEEVRFILVDPKMVELMPYNGIPHLLVPVIIDPEEAAIALKWAVSEMEERYKKLAQLGLRNIKSYNQYVKNDKMPYIVVIIDELADLMMVSANSVEISIARIAQKARAVGIHLIVATQRPSTDVITGMIKANLPSRISFAVRSHIDSRTILDQMGAEKLLGMGDMFVLENGSSILERVQGAYISDEEVMNLTAMLKAKRSANYNMDILSYEEEEDSKNQDPLYMKAVEIVESVDDRISISKLQRDLSIGFNRASKLCEELRNNGIIDENNQKISY